MKEATNSFSFLFITGRPRSGTTLLRMLLDAHPNVIIPTECQFIVNLYGKYGHRKNWTNHDFESFLSDLQLQWKFNMWHIDLELLRQSLQNLRIGCTYADVCRAVYHSYKSIFSKSEITLLADKNPGYAIYTKKISSIFPDARFIYINRDYRDNYVSIKEVGFDLSIPSLPAQKWKYFYRTFMASARVRPENYLYLRYEDLVMRPQETMSQVCGFAGIPYDQKMFSFHEKHMDFSRLYNPLVLSKFHRQIFAPVNQSRLGIWKEKLTAKEICLLDCTVGRLASEAGYEPMSVHANLKIHVSALPGRLLAATLFVATKVVDKLPVGLRMNILSKWPRKAGMFVFSIVKQDIYKQLKQNSLCFFF
ncbi:MAG: hypothetical protein CVU06_03530 [Bacteroidetes bacterium HGW-Bacteroidetes-22]|nr:MAG: hypothetical protein CVU06_03530 [Bacteroidetes bacterium HGW-Bacteroidetes-22]